MKISYMRSESRYLTPCLNSIGVFIGSINCSECSFFKSMDIQNNVVDCSFGEENKMKEVFKNAKVGDKVWSCLYGWGKVINIDLGADRVVEYPLLVKFNERYQKYYDYCGNTNYLSSYPELYWQEPEIKYEVTERPEPEIDWTKVPVDIKVLVCKDNRLDDKTWEVRYFANYLPKAVSRYYCFYNGSKLNEAEDLTYWKYCKLHPDVEIKEEWLK
jgi:hypothetical protein